MFKFYVSRFVPKFILADKNGYAIAKAIEAAMQYMNKAIDTGVKCIYDFDTMPEWRLDELAWETNCLYDFHADVEAKRAWIRRAIPLYRLYGTPAAIYEYLDGYFDDIDVEENWQYGGDHYHFRVTVDGTWTPENEAWARKAIEDAKNVRSVLDALAIGSKCSISFSAECGILGRFTYPMTGADNWAGRWPQTNTLGALENATVAVQAKILGQPYEYPLTSERLNAGIIPDINMLGAVDDTGTAGLSSESIAQTYSYPAAGTIPWESTIGVPGGDDVQAVGAEDISISVPYKMCGAEEI